MGTSSARETELERNSLNRCRRIAASPSQMELPLHIASTSGRVDAIRLLLAQSNKVDADVNAQNPASLTPLHVACQYGRARASIVLLRAGADPLSTSTGGITPFMMAAASSRPHLHNLVVQYFQYCVFASGMPCLHNLVREETMFRRLELDHQVRSGQLSSPTPGWSRAVHGCMIYSALPATSFGRRALAWLLVANTDCLESSAQSAVTSALSRDLQEWVTKAMFELEWIALIDAAVHEEEEADTLESPLNVAADEFCSPPACVVPVVCMAPTSEYMAA